MNNNEEQIKEIYDQVNRLHKMREKLEKQNLEKHEEEIRKLEWVKEIKNWSLYEIGIYGSGLDRYELSGFPCPKIIEVTLAYSSNSITLKGDSKTYHDNIILRANREYGTVVKITTSNTRLLTAFIIETGLKLYEKIDLKEKILLYQALTS